MMWGVYKMKACGLIVEYNPFHNGHQFHLEQSRIETSADCMVAVMSGNFLQRGEPAIIDKFKRTEIAIKQGVDLVVELPYVYAVQNSDLFAHGATLTLGALGVNYLSFGSESGHIDGFIAAYKHYDSRQQEYQQVLKEGLANGLSFPEASSRSYQHIGLDSGTIDLTQPNNILGFSYVKSIFRTEQDIKPVTFKRYKNNYHDQTIQHSIASATSIRNELIKANKLTDQIRAALPAISHKQLIKYKETAGIWHTWELYFPLLQYRILTMSENDLRTIHGMEEGIENRLKQAAIKTSDFTSFMEKVKTKRYTRTRLQRLFTHILTNTKKTLLNHMEQISTPYIRLLGMSKKGQAYLNIQKKRMNTPVLTSIKRDIHPFLEADERASDAYYSILDPVTKLHLRRQEIQPPFVVSH